MRCITTSILVVDDYEPWRECVCSILQKLPALAIIGHASDGLEAVAQAEKLQPDLILLDIGLPTLNGIDAARRIRQVSPGSKILFVSENRSSDIAEAALLTGAVGYAIKSGAATELVGAVKAVLEGTRFVSTLLTSHDPSGDMHQRPIDHHAGQPGILPTEHQSERHRSGHGVSLYPNDATLVDGLTRFVEAALKNGEVAVIVATESHRADIFRVLQRDGMDVRGAVECQRYIALDVADSLPAMVFDGSSDGVRTESGEHCHLLDAITAATRAHIKVAVG